MSRAQSSSQTDQPVQKPAVPPDRTLPAAALDTTVDEGPDSLDWCVASVPDYSKANIVAGFSNLICQVGSGGGCL